MSTTRAKVESWLGIPVAWSRRARASKEEGMALLVVGLLVAGLATYAIDQWLQFQNPRNSMFPPNQNAKAQFTGPGSRIGEMAQMWKKVAQTGALKILGKRAPDFALPDVLTGHEVRLSVLRRNKPVVLLFGSFG